ncbi:MAG: hypothetical protein PVF58_03710 [Candidatus Methanofastidiosia archaeon]|jgi:hypothetical protein
MATHTNTQKSEEVDTGGILFAVFILFLGIFALTFDVSPFTGLFRMISMWPLILIGLGVWLVFKNIGYEKIGALVLALILIAAMYTVFTGIETFSGISMEKDVPPGATHLDASFDLALGTFFIKSTPDVLYRFKGAASMEPNVYTMGDRVNLDISLDEEVFIPFGRHQNEFEIQLNDTLATSIDIDMGMSTMYVDLSNLNVEEFTIDGGVSSVKIIFGETDTTADIDMGVSTITIHVPETVGVRITTDGLMSLSVPSDWIKISNGYESPNYGTATHKITLSCTVGIGTVKVAYIS